MNIMYYIIYNSHGTLCILYYGDGRCVKGEKIRLLYKYNYRCTVIGTVRINIVMSTGCVRIKINKTLTNIYRNILSSYIAVQQTT